MKYLKLKRLKCNLLICQKNKKYDRPCVIISQNKKLKIYGIINLTSQTDSNYERPLINTFSSKEEIKVDSYINPPLRIVNHENEIGGNFWSRKTKDKMKIKRADVLEYYNNKGLLERIYIIAKPYKNNKTTWKEAYEKGLKHSILFQEVQNGFKPEIINIEIERKLNKLNVKHYIFDC